MSQGNRQPLVFYRLQHIGIGPGGGNNRLGHVPHNDLFHIEGIDDHVQPSDVVGMGVGTHHHIQRLYPDAV